MKKIASSALAILAWIAPAVSAVGPDMNVPSAPCSKLASGELGFSAAYYACIKKGAGNSGLEAACTDKEWTRLDALLNTSYQAALKRLNARRATALRESQRAWLAMRRPH